MGKKALLIDTTFCIGCGACALACKEKNRLPGEVEQDLSARTLTIVREEHGVHVRRLCMHCETPTCASVCPVGAFRKTAMGPVVYEKERCIGCRYCMLACPFQVPRYEWDSLFPRVMKCDMCADRVKEGRPTACAEACPTGATLFGERDELIREAKRRIQASSERYIPHIYGLEEAGGTSVLFLSSLPFEQLGFRRDLGKEPLPTLTWEVLSKIPNTILLGGVFLFGIWWITNRRIRLEELRHIEEEASSDKKGEEGGS